MKSKRKAKILSNLLAYFMLAMAALMVLVPFYVIFITSFKDNIDAVAIPFQWWPKEWTLEGYYTMLFKDMTGGGRKYSTVLLGFLNTLKTVVPTMLIGVSTSIISAYAFAKMRFPYKKLLFSILLMTMMVPGVVLLTPTYLLYDSLNLTDTYFPLMVPGMFGTASCVFFLRQYFIKIPDELIEAAKIDGLGQFGILTKIMVPLAKPAILSQGILWFVNGYNDYLNPLLYLWTPDKFTLQIALNYVIGTYGQDWHSIMAGCVLALSPILLIYLFAQKYFLEGIATTGLKA